jgi:hypothetical protein
VTHSFAAKLVPSALVLMTAATAVAASPPAQPPKFWTVSRCEQVFRARDHWVPNAQGYVFHLGLTICVGTGGPEACLWTAGRRSRLYSQFTVFTRSRYIGGAVRSFTLTTRAGHGLVRIGPAGDQYLKWPAEFYFAPASVRLLATESTPARFRTIVAPLAAHVTEQENADGCTGAQ